MLSFITVKMISNVIFFNQHIWKGLWLCKWEKNAKIFKIKVFQGTRVFNLARCDWQTDEQTERERWWGHMWSLYVSLLTTATQSDTCNWDKKKTTTKKCLVSIYKHTLNIISTSSASMATVKLFVCCKLTKCLTKAQHKNVVNAFKNLKLVATFLPRALKKLYSFQNKLKICIYK